MDDIDEGYTLTDEDELVEDEEINVDLIDYDEISDYESVWEDVFDDDIYVMGSGW